MAKTGMTTSEDLTRKVWDELLFREAEQESYFSRYMGGPDKMVHVKTQLEKQKGDEITFGLIPRIEADAVLEGTPLEGNEVKLQKYSFKVKLESYRQGVRSESEISEQRASWDVPEESRMALKEWGGRYIDTLCFTALKTSPTRVFYKPTGGAPATTTSLAAAKSALVGSSDSYLSPKLFAFADTWCKTGGNRKNQAPLTPLRIKGKNYYILLIHPDVGYDIRQDSTYAQYIREAEVRGPENPAFTNALAIVNGVVLQEHEAVTIGTDAGSGGNVPYAHNFLLGAQALCWAWGRRPKTKEQHFDYDEETGWGWKIIAGVKKANFNSQDFGVVSVLTARTQISDAT